MSVPPEPDDGLPLRHLSHSFRGMLAVEEDNVGLRRHPVQEGTGNRTVVIKYDHRFLVCRAATYNGRHFFVGKTIALIQITSPGEIRVDSRRIQNCEAGKNQRTAAKSRMDSVNT